MAEIKRVSYTHEALINWLIENPQRPLRDAAAYFGYTQAWLSTVIHSDMFQAKLKERQDAVFAYCAQDIPAQLTAGASLAIGKLVEKIEATEDGKFLLDAADKLLHRMGYAPQAKAAPVDRPTFSVTQNNTFINVPRDDLAAARQLMAGKAAVLAGESVRVEEPALALPATE